MHACTSPNRRLEKHRAVRGPKLPEDDMNPDASDLRLLAHHPLFSFMMTPTNTRWDQCRQLIRRPYKDLDAPLIH